MDDFADYRARYVSGRMFRQGKEKGEEGLAVTVAAS